MNSQNQIPKTIHYCWFGRNKMSKNILDCLDSWKKTLSEYEIICWNEDNFDIHSNIFVEEAYNAKKWAFVSDYVRLHVLYNHGGIYLDTDVKIIKPLDTFLNHRGFLGFENKLNFFISTGTIGFIKNHEFIKKWFDYYNDKHFILPDGKYNTITNVSIVTQLVKELYGFEGNGKHQVFGDDIHIYPFDFFSCYNGEQDYGIKTSFEITNNTHTIHLFAGSWLPKSTKRRKIIQNFIGYDNYNKITNFFNINRKIKRISGLKPK